MNNMFINVFIVLQNNRKVNEGGIMKTEKNIFWAFLLNLLFSIFEFVGGAFIGSVAIVSDALHDASDFISTREKKPQSAR